MMSRALPPLLLVALAAACGAPVPADTNAVKDAASTVPAAPTDAAAPATAAETAIPAEFHGTYDRNREACASRSEYRLTVSANALRFHESLATVRRVTRQSADSIEVTADFGGEGQSWSASQQLRLGDGGARLIVTRDGSPTARIRCDGSAAPPPSGWETAASGEGDALFLEGPSGRRLTLFCPSGSSELLVNVPGFRPVGSEERMSFGSGGTVVALVADTRGDSGRGGVSGRGPVPTELERILVGSGGIAVNYGAQNSGPHPRPAAELARTFAAGCRD